MSDDAERSDFAVQQKWLSLMAGWKKVKEMEEE